MTPNLQSLLSCLPDHRQTADRQWEATCPAHEDNRASLCIGLLSVEGMIGINCQAGCDSESVMASINQPMTLLFPPKSGRGAGKAKGAKGGTIVATYDYHDHVGVLQFQSVRFEPKGFSQRKPKDGGGWDWSVKGCRKVVFRLPELLKADPSKPVFIFEGEKDVDNARAKGLTATCNAGGAGKWTSSHANDVAGYHIVIVPDNDEAGRKHAAKVAATMPGKAKSTKVLELPDLPAKGDISDWFAAGGTAEQLLALAAAAPEYTAAPAEEPEEGEKGFAHQLADLITAEFHFAVDSGGKGYRYADGTYRAGAESFIKARVKQLCITLEATKQWSRKLAEEVVAFILVDAVALWDRPPLDVLNVANGLLRIADRVLLPHSPAFLSTVQLPVAWDPAATCPRIEQFAADVFPADAVALAYEVPAWLMTPDVSIQKAVLLLGAGGNGKSTWLTLLVAFLGRSNCVGLSLHKIEGNKFAVARLQGKLANVCPDLPTEHLAGTSMFKALTGTDIALEGEHKFRDGFSFDPYARLVFSANAPPRSSDASEGFFDRWLVVPFEARFRGTKRELTRRELDARLAAPAELSGLLNKAVDAWHTIQGRGGRLINPESVQAAWRDFHASTDPLSVWLDQFTVDDPDAVAPKHVMRAAYGTACEQAGRTSPGAKEFGHAIRKARPELKDKQRVVNGKLQWCYIGIGMRDEPGFYSQDSRDSRDNPPIPLTRVREGKEEGEVLEGARNTGGAHPVNPVNVVNGNGRELSELW